MNSDNKARPLPGNIHDLHEVGSIMSSSQNNLMILSNGLINNQLVRQISGQQSSHQKKANFVIRPTPRRADDKSSSSPN